MPVAGRNVPPPAKSTLPEFGAFVVLSRNE